MISLALGLILYKVISTFIMTCVIYFVADKVFHANVNFLMTWGIMFVLALIF